MTPQKEQIWTFHYPSSEPKPLTWMSGKNIETEEAAQKCVCEVFRRREGEYLIEHENDTFHVLLSGDVGSCACKDFKVRNNLPCVHLFALRKAKMTGIIKNATPHQHELINMQDQKTSPFLTTAEKREAATTKLDQTPPEDAPPAPSKSKVTCICKHCGQETTREQAERCLDLMIPLLCPECEKAEDEKASRKTTRNGSEPSKEEPKSLPAQKEPAITNPEHVPVAAQPAQMPSQRTKKELVAGNCEAIAKQYGIPSELANMYFMSFEGTAYIKNPGLLHLASKKGYSRIEITDHYDEKAQEWIAECKIYPRLDARSISAISHLKNEKLQEQALEYVMKPTNGTGRAGKHNVKMTTMHIFLREMAQTRAANRALRNFTGFGGCSAEETDTGTVEVS